MSRTSELDQLIICYETLRIIRESAWPVGSREISRIINQKRGTDFTSGQVNRQIRKLKKDGLVVAAWETSGGYVLYKAKGVPS